MRRPQIGFKTHRGNVIHSLAALRFGGPLRSAVNNFGDGIRASAAPPWVPRPNSFSSLSSLGGEGRGEEAHPPSPFLFVPFCDPLYQPVHCLHPPALESVRHIWLLPKTSFRPMLSSKRIRGGIVIAGGNSPAGHPSERHLSMNILDLPQNGQLGLSPEPMNIGPKRKLNIASPQSTPRRRRGRAAKGRMPVLGAKDLQLHRELMNDGRLKSGRAGAYVYYVREGRQQSRLYVVPRDPRTPAQQRARARFGAASRTWSAIGPLTNQQRESWRCEAAKTRSCPRLGTSGMLTGQQAFVGRNCARNQREHDMLLEPAKGEKQTQASQPHPPVLVMEVKHSQKVTQSTWDQHR